MRVLIVKTTSMGDVIHTLPALTDAARIYPDIQFDWVVEQPFAEIPRWHSRVNKVIPVAWRRWRKNLRQSYGELTAFYRALRSEQYDLVIDAQGLIKSAVIARLSRGVRCGLDFRSAWEPLASLAYQRRVAVLPEQHAVVRVRSLFAGVLGYPIPTDTPDYGIDCGRLPASNLTGDYLVFLHGTTWDTKHWPVAYWQALAERASVAGLTVVLPWGNEMERQRAEEIAKVSARVHVLPKLSLAEIAGILSNAKAVVAVDTGLGHLAAALAVPTVSLYGPTDPQLTGTYGANQHHLAAKFGCAPCLKKHCTYKGLADVLPACFATVSPDKVWQVAQSVGQCLTKEQAVD